MHTLNAKPMVLTGVFIALTILFTYVFSIQTPFVRLSFGFLPIAVYAAMFGTLRGGIMAATADILGMALFPTGASFPGFTLSSCLSGCIYGYFLHRQSLTFQRISIPFLLIFTCIDLGLNTLWLSILYQKAASAFFISRLIKNLICLPINILLFSAVYRPISLFLPKITSK